MTPLPSIQLTVNFIKEKKQVIAYSPALDISTVGDSEEHAKSRFVELVKMFLEDISMRGVVKEVLTELGWTEVSTNSRPQWIPPVIKSVDLQVPLTV